MSRAAGSSLVAARAILAERGVVVPWEIADSGDTYPLRRMLASGEAVRVRESTLYARPDVAEAIERAIAATVGEAVQP